jgi:hypothetical protein
MFKNLFHKNNNKQNNGEKSHVVVLKQTRPGECGGTDATRDTRAPRTITSDEMIFFSAGSALGRSASASNEDREDAEPLWFVSAFAAPAGGNTFVLLETSRGYAMYGQKDTVWALVRGNIFPLLTEFVRAHDLARDNGYHSRTHGLPEDFGGSVDIRYADGENISFSDNQTPVLSPEEGREMAKLFRKILAGEKSTLPDAEALKTIRFEEVRDSGGFTQAALTIGADGCGVNEKQACYDGSRVFESAKPVDKETVDAIKKNIVDTGLLAWAELPDNGYQLNENKKLTFEFVDGSAVEVRSGRQVPDQLRSGFFNIELEMTTKH